VELDDRITIQTPEGVELALELAGLGSRFIAGGIDLVVQGLSIVILAVISGVIGGGGGLLTAVFVVLSFAIWFFYNVLFEVLRAGRTPGKALNRLRVVRRSGAPVDLTASAIRNLVRIVDGPTLLYLPSIVSIAVTRMSQRPGDMAAGTVVIREHRPSSGAPSPVTGEGSSSWDLSAVSAAEVAAVRRFLERRETLERAARRELAVRLASGLRGKVGGVPEGIGAERFLEQLVGAKARRR